METEKMVRDRKRITRILKLLEQIWDTNGNFDLRLGQLLENLCVFPQTGSNCFQLWFQEDDATEEKLEYQLKKMRMAKKK